MPINIKDIQRGFGQAEMVAPTVPALAELPRLVLPDMSQYFPTVELSALAQPQWDMLLSDYGDNPTASGVSGLYYVRGR